MARKKDQPGDERPWNEEQWEAFLKESDLRAARFGEILETVMDDPDRDAIIDRHMGWDRDDDDDADAADDEEADPDFNPEAIMEEAAAEVEAEKREREARGEDPFPDEDDDVKDIPAYGLANEVGLRVHRAIQPFVKERVPEDPEEWDRDEIDERLGEASIGCMIAAAKIAGGHGMGYEDDVLCGNIANVKRGLAGADQCEAALLWLREKNALPAGVVDKLLPDVRAVQQAVRERIVELRQRVWW